MVIETKRLIITTASQDEMISFIKEQTDEILIKAYGEMLQGCLDHPDHWDWYAIWFIRTKCGSHIGDLSFKGLNADGSVEIGYGISEIKQGNGYATEAVNAAVTWALKQPGVFRVEAETEHEFLPVLILDIGSIHSDKLAVASCNALYGLAVCHLSIIK